MEWTIFIEKQKKHVSNVFLFNFTGEKIKREQRRRIRIDNETDSSSSTISSSAIRSIIDKLKYEGRRSSTRKNYHTVWKLFNQFFIKLDVKPATWEDRLILLTGYLIDNGRKSSTVKSYILAIKAVLREDDVELNEDRYLLNSLIKSCRYYNDTVQMRFPICKDLVRLIIQQIPTLFSSEQPYLVKLYQTIISTAYFGLSRIGELTESEHVVKAKDVHIGTNKNKLLFILRTSKTHWTDVKPQVVKISSMPAAGCQHVIYKKKEFCPFRLLQEYIALQKKALFKDEQFFVFNDRSPVKPSHVRNILKNSLIHLGLDPVHYGCHSLRAGRAVDLHVKFKLDIAAVKHLG